MSSGSARRALSGMAWLLPDGGPFRVPGADIDAGFGFAAPGVVMMPVEGPAIGDDREGAKAAVGVPAGAGSAGGTTILKAHGH